VWSWRPEGARAAFETGYLVLGFKRFQKTRHLVDPTCRLNPICRDDLPYERRRSVRKQNSAGLGHLDIGRAIAILFAAQGRTVQLAGQDTAALQREARDIAARSGTRVTTPRHRSSRYGITVSLC